MPLLPADERQLQRALDLAEAAAAFASPNPTVGCVLTQADRPIGAGAHRYDERDHAEIVALKHAAAAGHAARGATAYVTLEPCSHHGRTGPCADALVAAEIARCVVATVDPNPLVRGKGLARLRSAGVEITVADPGSALARRARRLNDAFAFSIQHNRPFITLKSALSSDGYLAPPPGARTGPGPVWLTGPAARAEVQRLRHASDALLTGIGTVLADDPELSDRSGLPRRQPLQRFVLDSELRTPLDSKLVRHAAGDLLLFAGEHAPAAREAALRSAGIRILRLPSSAGQIALESVVGSLAAQPLRSLLVEAGSGVNGSFLAHDLVDRVVLYQSPHPLGPGSVPFAQGQASALTLLHRLGSPEHEEFEHGSAADTRVAGYLHDPWSGV
jgi:diaminohydroxyphosphoribosylaminopyrimidine deaminase/5-amino-6-(5-phosphoribosylamino)uracil reductase